LTRQRYTCSPSSTLRLNLLTLGVTGASVP